VKPEKLDHVALYVPDPEGVAASLLSQLPFRILEQTDEFVLVGRAPELGKLTFFEARGSRQRGQLLRIGIGIPAGVEQRAFSLGDDTGLELVLVPSDPGGEIDLVHVALATEDPSRAAQEWLQLGLEPAPKADEGVCRVRIGGAFLELHRASPAKTESPLLNHLGLLVESIDEVDRDRLDVIREVDAEHSRAVFVEGPDGVEVEYIEHKPSFALA
jgi:catechol 2,3-dioxygenase-like lactoylglutathione lyase family enzyme